VVAQEINTDQGVREAMLATESGTSYVQLLQPLSPDTPVGKFLEKRGEGMHHVGYAVADVSAALAELGATGIRLIDSRPRHGSMGASIAFLHPKDLGGVLTELVQPGGPPRTPREPDGRHRKDAILSAPSGPNDRVPLRRSFANDLQRCVRCVKRDRLDGLEGHMRVV
jgi:methylmalonyl-CoA/ethylmalonyl-CoA epimerase